MKSRLTLHSKGREQGFLLIMVLVIIMLASMVAASLLFSLGAEETAAAAGASADQAWATAMSGVYQAMRVAAESDPASQDWQENPSLFRDQLVCDDGARKWYYTVYCITNSDTSGLRYGLEDEASKLNVNWANETMLEAMPGLTPVTAQALMSFTAMGSTLTNAISGTNAVSATAANTAPNDLPPVRVSGSDTNQETNVDSDLPPVDAASAAGGTISVIRGTGQGFTSLEELLQVPGFTPGLLYGEDANLNGRLDPNEDDADASFPPDNHDGQLDTGLRPLLTASSYDLNLDSEGKPRLNLNDPATDLSSLNLPTNVLEYVQAMHRSQKFVSHPADLLEATNTFKATNGVDAPFRSGVGQAELAVLLDRCTATNQIRLPGLINLNTASAQVLAALPGLNATLAESIVGARAGLSPEARKTPAWLYAEGLVNADAFKQVAPFLTTRSYQFHFHVAAYSVPPGTFRVIEAVIDTAVKPPALLYLRDITRLGLPFAPPAVAPELAGGDQ